jgi:hypothetical protein
MRIKSQLEERIAINSMISDANHKANPEERIATNFLRLWDYRSMDPQLNSAQLQAGDKMRYH